MIIDLKELADSAGIRKSRPGYNEKLVSVPLNRAKKLLKLIRQYSYREEDLQKVDRWMAKNPKLAVYWRTIR